MWGAEEFRKREKGAQILQRNSSYVFDHHQEALERAAGWLARAGVELENEAGAEVGEESPLHKHPPRILTADAARTFWDEKDRAAVVKFMASAVTQFRIQAGEPVHADLTDAEAMKTYHQGFGFVGSLMWLFLEEKDALRLLAKVNDDSKYLRGYWRHQPVAFSVDALVLGELLELRVPEVASHLKEVGVLPDTFAQKWFVGLCVHVLPFDALFNFLEQFFDGGRDFLLRFGVAFCREMRDALLAESQQHTLYAILRLDEKMFPGSAEALRIVEAASLVSLEGFDVEARRAHILKTVIQPRLDAAAAAHAEQSARAAGNGGSDDEDDEEDDDSPCDVCDEKPATMNCEDCNKFLCPDCHSSEKSGHKSTHQVTPFDEDDE